MATDVNKYHRPNAQMAAETDYNPGRFTTWLPVLIHYSLVRSLGLWVATILVLAGHAGAAELTAESVAVLAGACVNCHAPQGRLASEIPALRGLTQEQLRMRLTAFRDGAARDATVMPRLMKGYDEAQIQALAKWFARDEKQ